MRGCRSADLGLGIGVLAIVIAVGCSEPALNALPENPCALLSTQQVASAAGVEVSRALRQLSQRESIEAGRAGREPAPGSVCRYETPGELVSIAVILPDRRGPLGSRWRAPHCVARPRPWETQDDRVWMLGARAAVCVGPDLFVWVSVQMGHEPGAVVAATGVARAILRRLPS